MFALKASLEIITMVFARIVKILYAERARYFWEPNVMSVLMAIFLIQLTLAKVNFSNIEFY